MQKCLDVNGWILSPLCLSFHDDTETLQELYRSDLPGSRIGDLPRTIETEHPNPDPPELAGVMELPFVSSVLRLLPVQNGSYPITHPARSKGFTSMDNTNDFNAKTIKEFRENGGRVGGRFAGASMVLLHTIGAKSGKEHVNPLVSFPFEGRRYITGSAGGGPKHPAWYHNLVANPDVTIEIGEGTEAVRGSVL